MGKSSQKKSDRHTGFPFFPVSLLLLCLVLITTSLMTGLYARFTAEDAQGQKAEAAAFVFTMKGTSSEQWYIDTESVTKPGDSKECAFTLTNTSGTAVSEVNQSVTMTLQLNGSMPLKCTIRDSKGTTVLEVDAEDAESFPTSESSEAITWKAGVTTSDAYVLTVEWPKDRNDAVYASGASGERVELVVDSVQLD